MTRASAIAWRFPNAPDPLDDEARSSWVARLAHAHGLEAQTLLKGAGSAPALDIGLETTSPSRLAAAGAKLRAPRHDPVAGAVREARWRGVNTTPRLDAVDWWTWCPSCARGDLAAGRPVHVRAGWAHPLAAVCLEHEALLKPWPRSAERRGADGRIGFVLESGEGTAERAPHDLLQLALRLERTGALDWPGWAAAVFDLADALCARTGFNGVGEAALRLFEPSGGLGRLPGSRVLPEGVLFDLDAYNRQRVLTVAARLLAHDPLHTAQDVEGRAWLIEAVRRSRSVRPFRKLTWAACDPLHELMMHLNSDAADALAERASNWVVTLRPRMSAATLMGAMANYA